MELLRAAPLAEFHARFHPQGLFEGDRILRAISSFLSQDQRALLLECLVVEGYLRQSFFMLLTESGSSVMVRLLPRTSPEKTEGVKRCVVWVASLVRADRPEVLVGKTNLRDFLA